MNIKKECELEYAKISAAQDRLKELRNSCNHKNVITTNYSYRIGATMNAKVCDDCGELIEYMY